MNHFGLTDFEVFQRTAGAIQDRRVMSWLELARRARVPSDDILKRALQRLSSQFGGVGLVVPDENRCLKLTAAGKEFSQFLMRMNFLGDQEATATKVSVIADPLVMQILLPVPLAEFFSLWGSSASVRLLAVDGLGSVRKEILEGRGDFSLSFAEHDETVSEEEAIGPKLPWVMLVKKDHRLNAHRGAVIGEQLQNTDRVFLPGLAAKNEELEAFLAPIPRSGRVECESVLAMVDAGLGLGIIPDLHGNQDTNGMCKLAIEGAAPSSQLRLVLPRKGRAGLSEPAEALVQSIRNACESRFASPVNGEAMVPERAAHSLFQESTPQLAETVHDR